MGESSLHIKLKDYFANQGAELEVNIGGCIIDARLNDLLIEIQIQNLFNLKPKLDLLLEEYKIRIIHPIALDKWIVYLPKDKNQPARKRKSPKHGQFEHLFEELVFISNYVTHKNFSIEAFLIIEEEIRNNDGNGSWRRKGWSIFDRKLVDIVDQLLLTQPDDYRQFIPKNTPRPFTTIELAHSLRLPKRIAYKLTYTLRTMQVIKKVGKKGRSILYSD